NPAAAGRRVRRRRPCRRRLEAYRGAWSRLRRARSATTVRRHVRARLPRKGASRQSREDARFQRAQTSVAVCVTCSILICMTRRRAYRAVSRVDPKALAEFQAGIRKRYSDAQILEQLTSCATRLGRSPTMREFADDPETTIHPQTVIERFGSWNRAKRAAGPVPGRLRAHDDLRA